MWVRFLSPQYTGRGAIEVADAQAQQWIAQGIAQEVPMPMVLPVLEIHDEHIIVVKGD